MAILKSQSPDTKTRIMEVAFELFGQEGFDGTSIREIAKRSGSNIAGVNYHFKSKENLYWEVMAATFKEVHFRIQEISKEAQGTIDLAMKTYDYFLTEKNAVRAIMKMMLTDLMPPKDLSEEVQSILMNPMGPPGGEFFAESLIKEVPYPMSREGLMWGVKSLFGVIHHWGVLFTCHCLVENQDPMMSEEQVRSDVESMLESHLSYLIKNKEKFKA